MWQRNMTSFQELVDVNEDLRLKNKFNAADQAKFMSNGVSSDDVADKFNTILIANGEICGKPDDGALLSGRLPEDEDSLMFLTSFALPAVGRSAVQIDIGYLKKDNGQNVNLGDPAIVVLGQINLALKNARAHEPEWNELSPEQAAEALGVKECAPMWKLTITGRPNLSLENVRGLSKTTQARQDEFSRLRGLCNTKKDVKISIITPRFKVDVVDLLRPFVNEAWKRDGGEPLQPFFEGSKYKHVVNLETIAPPEQAPYQKPVPAVVTFTDVKQYAVTMAYGNQSEYYCQQDQARDLAEATGMTAVFLADPGYVVKECNTPRVLLFWLRVPQSQMSLAPKAGQSGYLILPRVNKLKHDLSDEELAASRFSDTELVCNEIWDALNQASKRSYTGPQFDSFLTDKLNAMLSNDEGSTDVDELLAAIVEIIDDEGNDDDMTMSKLKQLVAKTKSLKPPTTPQDPLLNESEPVRLSWRRIGGVGSLMPSNMACYRAQVPVDTATGTKRWPVKLDLPDLTRDTNGNQLRQNSFVEKFRNHRGTPVQIYVEDSDKTYRMEMNAISKLVHPLTFNEHDRCSEAMESLFHQMIFNNLQDKLPAEQYIPIWRDIHDRVANLDSRIAREYGGFSKDKKQAFLQILLDRKTIKAVIGPPGTGKTTFTTFLALTSLLTVGARDRDNERHGPVAGSRLSEKQLDQQLDALANCQDSSSPAEPGNDQGNGKEAVNANDAPPRANFQVLYVLDMNQSVNDVVGMIQGMAQKIGLVDVAGEPLSVIRLHSIKAEMHDVPKKYLPLFTDLQRDNTEFNGLHGAVLELIIPMMRKVEEAHQRARAERRVGASLTEATRREYEEHEDRYLSLSHLISKVVLSPDIWPDNKAEIFRQVCDGPMAQVLRKVHIIVATPVGAGDSFLRKHFKPDMVIQDEAARSKEMSSLILLAAHSPLVYILVGDTKQNGPYVTSLFQHYEPRQKMSSTISTFGRNHEQVRAEKEAQKARSGELAEEPEPGPHTAADANDEIIISELPQRARNPNTFGPQTKQSLLARLERGGSVLVVYLRQNFRHNGPGGELMNTLWYDKDLQFRNFRETKTNDYQAALSILGRCGKESEPMALPVWDEETQQPVIDPTTKEPEMKPVIIQPTFQGNSIIIDMSSKESAHGFSYRNDANLAYARQKLIDCLEDQPIIDRRGNQIWHKLQGNTLYVCPYTSQLDAMKWAMQELGKWAYTSSGKLVEVDLARFDFRTHMGVQGFQASMVIVDYVRSRAPGHSGDPQINNVMLSRACFGQILLLNNSVLERVNQHAPANVTIKNVFRWHRANDAVIDTLNHKDMVVCNRCVGLGHTAGTCPKSNDPTWKCHACGKPHHPRECRQLLRINADLPPEMTRPTRQVNEAKVPPKPVETADTPSSSKKPPQKTQQQITLLAIKRAMRKG